MKEFSEVASPNVKQFKLPPANLDSYTPVYEKERVREEIIICRIVPAIVAVHPELLDMTPTLRHNNEIGMVYKKINDYLDN